MARRKAHRRYFSRARRVFHKAKPTLPISVIAPLAASFMIEPTSGWMSPLTTVQAIASGQTQYAKNLGDQLLNGWLFLDSSRGYTLDLSKGLYTKMMLAGLAVHWAIGKLGINRALGRAKIPYVRI